jgi:hypothetical protein
MFQLSCTFVGIALILLGSSGNGLCILIFLRQKFRHRIITPYFIALLVADSIYLIFRLIKLFYYSQTLLKTNAFFSTQTCAKTFFVRAYQHATQKWPQMFVPLIHPKTYVRFSLILMCIVSVQRTTFISRSIKRLILPSTYTDEYKHKLTILFILCAFALAYAFEFAGLTLFCSRSLNRDIAYDWFLHMTQHLDHNATLLFTNALRPNRSHSLSCVVNGSCAHDELIDIVTSTFDQHQRSIVHLIQTIVFNQTAVRVTRNEIRRQFHFHECLFPQQAPFFHRHYNFMYSRVLGVSRYTLRLGKFFFCRTFLYDLHSW